MFVSKVDKNGRATIPAEIRKILDLSEKDEVIWLPMGKKVEIIKKHSHSNKEIDEWISFLKRNPLKCFISPDNEETLSLQSEAMDEWYLSKLGLRE